jgi:MerR family transcriptional regulator, thiopeptide resistance regulator
MKYGVKALADVSGVTVRTLHFYDELGLLKPAYYGSNGYRVYDEKQLLVLQQILFFRELGFELKQIKRILNRSDFDLSTALVEHRRVLQKNLARTRELIRTIDQTLEHLKGKRKMKDTAMFAAFDQKQQAEYEKQLVDRYGETMREGIAESKRKVKDWTKADWERSGNEWDAICKGLVDAMKRGLGESSKDVQALVRRHFEWLKKFWTPNKESYAGHAEFLVTSDLRKAYDKYDPALAEFMARAMQTFAQRELA